MNRLPPIDDRLQEVEQAIASDPSILGLQAYEYLDNTGHDQTEAFQAGCDINLEYPKLDLSELMEKEKKARYLLLKLYDASEELSPKAAALYRALEWKHSEICTLGWAAIALDNRPDEDPRAKSLEWYSMADRALHGAPEEEVFREMMHRDVYIHLDDKFSPEDQPNAKQVQTELKGLIGEVHPTEYELFKPDKESLLHLRKLLIERFQNLVDLVDSEKEYTVDEIVDVLNDVLVESSMSKVGWTSECKEYSGSIAVSAADKALSVGAERGKIKGSKLQGRVLHEIVVHAMRSEHARQAGWLSAAYGQDNYLPFEEGCATAFEDAYHMEVKTHGMQYYLAVGLAKGLDGKEPRCMREVYEIIWRKIALKNVDKEHDLDDKTINTAKNKAFRECIRIFRGTTGKDPGVVYSKDLSYYTGQEKAWAVLRNIYSSGDLDMVLAGKLDLTDEFHRNIAKEIIRK